MLNQPRNNANAAKVASHRREGNRLPSKGSRQRGRGATSEVGGGPYEVHPALCGGTGATLVADDVTNVIVKGVAMPGVIIG